MSPESLFAVTRVVRVPSDGLRVTRRFAAREEPGNGTRHRPRMTLDLDPRRVMLSSRPPGTHICTSTLQRTCSVHGAGPRKHRYYMRRGVALARSIRHLLQTLPWTGAARAPRQACLMLPISSHAHFLAR